MKQPNKKRVLFSLYDQQNAVAYATQLVDLGWELIATSETVRLLKEHNIAARNVADFLTIEDIYPFPPTLHPKMELALTTDQAESIDFVYDTTYPVSEGNDVGGHTLLALAAKGRRIVAGGLEDMELVIGTLKKNNNEIPPALRQQLIDKAFEKISRHYFSLLQGARIENAVKTMRLAEGENPYQTPAFLLHMGGGDPLALGTFEQVSGVAPCFTNMADFDVILHALSSVSGIFMKHYHRAPSIVIAAKHGNPCGMAVDWDDPATAITKALWGNPNAIWGGEVITNFPIEGSLSQHLYAGEQRNKTFGNPYWMLDVVIAPAFDKDAVDLLGKSQRRKLFANTSLAEPVLPRDSDTYRMVRGGFLRQPYPDYMPDLTACRIDFAFPESEQVDSLIIAWAASWCANHGGNEIALAKNRALLSAGGGPSTIDACRTAVARAVHNGHTTADSVFAADAFFPFTDGPEVLMKAGCTYGLVPAGGKNEGIVRSYFQEKGGRVFFLPEQYRGFYRH